MNNLPSIFIINPEAHFMEPGTVAFIPGWIILFITILTFVMLRPKLFKLPYLIAFTVGSLMPAFDDLFAFIFGTPFAHHSLFHSLLGPVITYLIFIFISNKKPAKYALLGNLYHIIFNFYFDFLALFFPFTYQEFGLTDIIKVNTYWIKATHYPIIFALFTYALIKYFYVYRKK